MSASAALLSSSGVARNRAKTDARGLHLIAVERDRRADPDHRDIHLVARDEAQIRVARMRCGRGNQQFDQQLAGLEHSAPGRHDEILDRNFALAGWADDSGARAERDQRGRRVGGRRSIAKIAADRCAVLNLQRADQMRRLGQAGVMLAHHVALADLDARDGRAEAQSLFRIEGERLQFLDFFDVNQMLGAADSGAELDEDVGAAA